jgi:hypothetical protein
MLSSMSSREKAIVIVLAMVIVVSLIGIGLLMARLIVGGGDGGPVAEVTVTVPMVEVSPTLESGPETESTVTPVPNPKLDESSEAPPEPAGDQPAEVVSKKSDLALLPVMIMEQPLRGNRRYRIEIAAEGNSAVRIWGSWSQTAKGSDGELVLPLPEFIDAQTPHSIAIDPPLANPASWSISVSVAPRGELRPPGLVVTIRDVTGSQ